MTEVFRTAFVQATQDRVVDRNDLQRLRQTAASVEAAEPDSEDAQAARQVIQYLDQQHDTSDISYGLQSSQHDPLQVDFTITPTYSESDTVAGATAREQVANLSQSDTLTATNDDMNRCGAASMLNAYLLMGGSFNTAATQVGLPENERSMTYANVHKAQERLYDHANNNGEAGLTSGYSSRMQGDQILSATSSGEMTRAAQKLGVSMQPLLGNTPATLSQRQTAADAFWQSHPTGVMQVGVNLDQNTGNVTAPASAGDQNHYVLIQREGDHYVMTNSGVLNNGDGSASRQLSQEEYESFVNTNPGSVNGLYR